MVLCSPHAQTGGSISELTPLESQDKAWFPQLYPKDETPNIEPFINQQLMFKKKKVITLQLSLRPLLILVLALLQTSQSTMN